MSINKRIVAGVGANAYGQIITIGIQLLGLPVYLHFWDAGRFGTWLMLAAVPTYFTMADVGMITAAGNKMTMEIGRGDATAANRTFQSAFVFMFITCLAFLAPTLVFLVFLNVPQLENREIRLTLAILITVVLMAFFNGLAEAVFRATGRYGVGQALGQSIRLAEWSGGLLGLWWSGSFISVALGMLIARTLGVAVAIAYSVTSTNEIQWGIRQASASEVRAMGRPAAMFMMIPVVNALSIQGFTLLVGGLFGAVQVAIFNSYRTIARVTVQATSTFSAAAGPEMSRLYGSADNGSLSRLFRRANRLSAVFALSLPAMIAISAPTILHVWTHGRIPYRPRLLLPMLVYATVSSLWHVPRALLLSINRHSLMAAFSLAVAALSLFFAWLVGKRFSIDAVVWVLVIGELILAVGVHRRARQILGEGLMGTGEVQKERLD